MKTASAAYVAVLASGVFWTADLFTLTLSCGEVIRLTTSADPLTVNGQTFTGANIQRTTIKQTSGLEVGQVTLQWNADTSPVARNLSAGQLASLGFLDRAAVEIDRVVMAAPGDTSAGSAILFVGVVAQIDVDGAQISLQVNSPVDLLDVQLPRNLYQSGCVWGLFDAGCGLSPAAYLVNGSAQAGCTGTTIPAGLSQADGYFDLGQITFTSGQNAGLSRGVKSFAGGTFEVFPAFPVPPAAGDTFEALPGCNKTRAQCTATFNNLARFRGYPFVPVPETAI